MNRYTDWNKRIYKVSFILYDLNELDSTYYDNIFEFLEFHKISIGNLVYRLNHTTEPYIYIRSCNATHKLYYIED